jgi:hypothetical protein
MWLWSVHETSAVPLRFYIKAGHALSQKNSGFYGSLREKNHYFMIIDECVKGIDFGESGWTYPNLECFLCKITNLNSPHMNQVIFSQALSYSESG